jgi:hypothetical protein
MVHKIFILFLFIFSIGKLVAQTERNSDAYFGIQYKPLMAANFIGTSKMTLKDSSFESTFNQTLGYSIGGIVRVQLGKNIAIETGINQIKRNYNVNYISLDSNKTASKSLSFTSFDIPINTLFFVKMTEKIFLNTSLGPSIVFNPSNVASQIAYNKYTIFKAEGRRKSIFSAELNANLGFEYRTKKSGFYYIGTSARIPFAAIFNVATMYETNGTKHVQYGSINGTYLSLDFRYFFSNTKTKETIFQPGPIEQ